jgi:formylglycine-generating enzyme required for sulfatase activity
MNTALKKIMIMVLVLPALLLFVAGDTGTRGYSIVAPDSSGRGQQIKLYDHCYALIIGIDKYKDLAPSFYLNYAVKDAQGVAQVLKDYYVFDSVETLYNEQATREGIWRKITEMNEKMGENDAFFLFIAGHGITVNDVGYILPYDGSFNQKEVFKNISMVTLRDEIGAIISAKHIFYVVDACYSGSLMKRSVEMIPEVDLIYLKEITDEPVRYALTAGDRDQQVLDGGPKGHSVFTGRFIEVLTKAEGWITASQISSGIAIKVSRDAADRQSIQTPRYGALTGQGDFVFIRKKTGSTTSTTTLTETTTETGTGTSGTSSREKAFGGVEVKAKTAGTVYVGRDKKGEVSPGKPLKIEGLQTGTRQVRILYPDGSDEILEVTIKKGEIVPLAFGRDVALVGSLRVSVKTGGVLYIDGKERTRLTDGDTGMVSGVSAGTRSLEIVYPDKKKETLTVRVETGKTADVSFTYTPASQQQGSDQKKGGKDGFLLVEGGSVSLGSEKGESDEKPVHTAILASFWISPWEVTLSEYDQFCEASGRPKVDDRGWGRGRQPALGVTWYDAVEYCNWRSTKEGLTPCYTIDRKKKDPDNTGRSDKTKWTVTCDFTASGYRLPTEAEWEYAARGGSGAKPTLVSGGDKPALFAWYKENSAAQAQPVGKKKPNTLGLYDMSGNVLEWCWDWYSDSYYKKPEKTNPKGPVKGEQRIVRGGCWDSSGEQWLSASVRDSFNPGSAAATIGFRLVRTSR